MAACVCVQIEGSKPTSDNRYDILCDCSSIRTRLKCFNGKVNSFDQWKNFFHEYFPV